MYRGGKTRMARLSPSSPPLHVLSVTTDGSPTVVVQFDRAIVGLIGGTGSFGDFQINGDQYQDWFQPGAKDSVSFDFIGAHSAGDPFTFLSANPGWLPAGESLVPTSGSCL